MEYEAMETAKKLNKQERPGGPGSNLYCYSLVGCELQCSGCAKIQIAIEKEFKYKKQNMEKNITMSLETARKMWKSFGSINGDAIKTFLLDNFTKEELESKDGFSWEESWIGSGYEMDSNGGVMFSGPIICSDIYKRVFKTKKQALSALAFAQLSHIVAKYNESHNSIIDGHLYSIIRDGFGLSVKQESFSHFSFNSKNDAIVSLHVNYELWKQYWMIGE